MSNSASKNKKTVIGTMLAVCAILFTNPSIPLSGGPSQPEIQTFEPSGSSNLVNPFTGDFSYSIPIMDVGGYPIILNYSSGITMEQEASFVGLGWNLNPGAVNRTVRGVPDDFNGSDGLSGEAIRKSLHRKDNLTVGANFGLNLEIFGLDTESLSTTAGLTVGVNNNSYNGPGLDLGFSGGASVGEGAKTSLTTNLGLSSNNGVSFKPSLSFSKMTENDDSKISTGGEIGLSLNSRRGLEALTLQTSIGINRANGGYTNLLSGGSKLSFADPAYTPYITMPMSNISLSMRVKMGGELFGTTGNVTVGGYGSKQAIRYGKIDVPAYGYLYSQEAGDAANVLHDFVRDLDGGFNPDIPNLPSTQLTYDLYDVSGQGLQANFRPYRSDVGTVFDHEVILGGAEDFDAALEIAAGNTVKVGADITASLVDSRAGRWDTSNATKEYFKFAPGADSYSQGELVYFKQAGERTGLRSANTIENTLVGDEAIRFKLNGQSVVPELVNPALDGLPVRITDPASVQRDERQPRNLHFSYLTADEARISGLETELRNYKHFWESEGSSRFESIRRVGDHRKSHHISEITVIRDDGTRYIYGLPVYNTVKEEVSFSVEKPIEPPEDGLITYRDGVDDILEGADSLPGNKHFSKTETPPYAYAYLLTAILSSDYRDLKGDGPTADDLGTYTKFNYRQYDEAYRWRTPYTHKTEDGLAQAHWQPGHIADDRDDIGSYVYGEREVWHLHSIESRNFVAEFNLSTRTDGIAIEGRGGNELARSAIFRSLVVGNDPDCAVRSSAMDSGRHRPSYKLDCIVLYNKAERWQLRDAAVPLKTTHFFYDFSLTSGVPNANERLGKLALRRVAFSYRESQKAMLSPYRFHYDNNPEYDHTALDRWGQYKPSRPSPANNRRFPYTDQRSTDNDSHAGAWHLSRIEQPTGGEISVEYEMDDYAYVQNKRASQMFPIVATGSSPEETCTRGANMGCLYQGTTTTPINHVYLFFDLLEPIGGRDVPEATQLALLKEYVDGIDDLYVNGRYLVDLDKNLFEDIPSFVSLDKSHTGGYFGFDKRTSTTGPYTRAWVRLKPTEDNENPLARAVWQYLKIQLPIVAYGLEPSDDDVLESFFSPNPIDKLDDLPGMISRIADGIGEAIDGFYTHMRDEGRADVINLDASFMRLNAPTKRKKGGGSRVKEISFSDRWGEMTQKTGDEKRRATQTYRQEYTYTRKETSDGISRNISSGVAAYEPLLGGDENSLAQPIWYTHNDERLYQVGPLGQSYYPAPMVGYSRVKIRHLRPDSAPGTEDPQIRGTGYSIHEFYTAKDFPVVVKRTPLVAEPDNVTTFGLLPFSQDHMAASQGFSIILNDMHGKPRASHVYQEGINDAPISGASYEYLVTEPDSGQLVNRVRTAHKRGAQIVEEQQSIGMDYDAVVDAREHKTNVFSPGVQLNLDGFLAGIFPLFVPTGIPELAIQNTRFRSITLTKSIHRSGILKKSTRFDSGASLAAFNELWDAETGQVIATRTETPFGDSRYSMQIPAHWEYDRMGGAWANQGLTLRNISPAPGGRLLVGGQARQFAVGDELNLTYVSGDGETRHARAWVWQVEEDAIILINSQGRHVDLVPTSSTYYRLKIIRSGYRNQQSASAGHVETGAEPEYDAGAGGYRFTNVIDSAATEFAERWQTYGAYNVTNNQPYPTCACSPLNFDTPRPTVAVDPSSPQVALRDLLTGLQARRQLAETNVDLLPLIPDATRLYFSDTIDGYKYWQGRLEGSVLSGSIINAEGMKLCSVQLSHSTAAFSESVLQRLDFTTMDFRRDTDAECGPSGHYTLRTEGEGSPESDTVRLDTSCFQHQACATEVARSAPTFQCGIESGEVVNPFINGILGNFRPKRSYAYLTSRLSEGPLKNAGHYRHFQPYWSSMPNSSRENWQWMSEAKIVNPLGRALESQDALGRYQGEVYGFDFNVVKAAAKNARPTQVAVDDFEDYAYKNAISAVGDCEVRPHWSFQELGVRPDAVRSHSGRHSLHVRPRESVTITRDITEPCDVAERLDESAPLYLLQRCDLIQPFNPSPGEYLLSAWVMTQSEPATTDPVPVGNASVQVRAGSARVEFTPTGHAVDGWQRVEGRFSVAPSATNIAVELRSGEVDTWFDDIRIHPFNANINTYVYDSTDLRFRATLGPNNYATFHDYNEEGALSRQKRETDRGIITVQEVGRGLPMPPPAVR